MWQGGLNQSEIFPLKYEIVKKKKNSAHKERKKKIHQVDQEKEYDIKKIDQNLSFYIVWKNNLTHRTWNHSFYIFECYLSQEKKKIRLNNRGL